MHKEMPETPRREITAAALILNRAGDVLLVEPHGSGGMTLPGGKAMQNEPPHMAVTRKVRDGTGLEVVPVRFLVVDTVPGNIHEDEWESTNFVFYCGIVNFSAPRVADAGELKRYQWAEPARLTDYTGGEQLRRIRESLGVLDLGSTTQYLFLGTRVDVRVNGAVRALS
ncbi:NUDIX domain-containing protein [Streptomyces sp. NPDC017941]|uniref:NUDIX domain-containing protein n=1 Tax=Streptomyces sp. NPDC017941 TaxID=3365018 RepID=UPI0037BA0A41